MIDAEAEALLLLAVAEESEEPTRKKRKWVHELNTQRKEFGEFHTLIPLLRMDDEKFLKYFRMPQICFDEVLTTIQQSIQKKSTNYREPIEPNERLAICLR